MSAASAFRDYVNSPALAPVTIVETDGRAIVFDFSTGSTLGGEAVVAMDTARMSAAIDTALEEAGTAFGFGRYAEPRELYRNELFLADDSIERRTVHMGIDLFCAAGTPVHAPLDGVVEIVMNNAQELDYGPLIVLRHGGHAEGNSFFTLYGHLTLDTLDHLQAGQTVSAGQQVARVGAPPDNGNWPPHLHFQLIRDLLDLGADFPGVTAPGEQEYWLELSPSPARFFPEHDPADLEY